MASFEEISTRNTLFRDSNALSPHFVPTQLPFREQQIDDIKKILAPALSNQKPRNLFIYGKTGTGKTASVKRIMDDFNKENKNASMHYVNCRIYNSRYRLLQKVLKTFAPELEKAGFGLPFLYEKLIEIAGKGYQILIILDEIDMIKDLDELIYTLTRANDEIKNGGVSIIGISNRLSFKDVLDPRSKSSLYETEIIFPPYTSEQLVKILEQRVQLGFQDNVVEQSAINITAAITAQENGDARYALKLLFKAGEIADQSGKNKISDTEVETARKKIEVDIVEETIATLPENHLILLYAVSSLVLNGSRYALLEQNAPEGFLFSGEVYEEYGKTCKQLHKRTRSLRWYHEYLNDLEMLGLIAKTPSSKGIRGHTTLIKLDHDAAAIAEITAKNLNIETKFI